MLTVLGIALFVVAILLSIALHEVGHLVPAKRFGVRVTQYMVGFGPTAWSRRRGETEYGIKWIPLGGYIRMIGMFPPKRGADPTRLRAASTGPFQMMMEEARAASLEEVRPGDEDRVFYRLPARKKVVVMLGGPVMNLLIAVVVLSGTLVTVGLPMRTTTLSQVVECVVPAREALERAEARRAGQQVEECRPGDPVSPAAEAGLRPGDEIVAVDGLEPDALAPWADVQAAIRAAPDQPVRLTIRRDGQVQDLTVTPTPSEQWSLTERGATETVGFLGVSTTREAVPIPVTRVPGFVVDAVVDTAAAVARVPARMEGIWHAAFSGEERDPQGPIGVVGVSRIGGEVAATDLLALREKVSAFLLTVASLNLALFVFNLIPLLPLDGGHVAGAVYEGARRHLARWRRAPDPGPVDVAKMLPVAYSVAILLVAMSALLLYADLVNPVRLAG